MACKFFYTNYWDDYTLTETSEHENFPAENTQHRDFNKAWRSEYGAGSGWGNFSITANVNDRLDLDEGGGEFPVIITPGTYNADTLATMIGSQMTATSLTVGNTWTYVCSYDDVTNKFTIEETSGPNNFSILWKTGTHGSNGTGRTVGETIGFSEDADSGGEGPGAATYTANDLRIHSEERISIDFGTDTNIYAVFIRGHNFSASATVKAEFSSDNFTTVHSTTSFTIQDDILALEWTTPKNYQYARIWIEDRENSDLYVKMGRVFFGTHFQPTRSFLEVSTHAPLDPSVLKSSENGQFSSIQLDHYFTKNYSFIMESADKSNFNTMFTSCGTSKGLFFTKDTGSYLTTTDYVRFSQWQFNSILHSSSIWRLDVGVEKLR